MPKIHADGRVTYVGTHEADDTAPEHEGEDRHARDETPDTAAGVMELSGDLEVVKAEEKPKRTRRSKSAE